MILGYRLSILPQKEQTKFAKQTYVGRPGFQGLVAYSPILGSEISASMTSHSLV
jgi:hypothetical protein